MKAILGYHASCGVELLRLIDGEEALKTDSWLVNLVKEKHENSPIEFVGRDENKRVYISMNVELFIKIKADPMFVMKADKLTHLITKKESILDHLLYSSINEINNDLDNSPCPQRK